jgi:hypothetical protein
MPCHPEPFAVILSAAKDLLSNFRSGQAPRGISTCPLSYGRGSDNT